MTRRAEYFATAPDGFHDSKNGEIQQQQRLAPLSVLSNFFLL
jgi:hypothetical protein